MYQTGFLEPAQGMCNVWMYWEGTSTEDMPSYLSLCRRTVEVNCSDIRLHLVTPENLRQYLPGFSMSPLLDGIRMHDHSKSSVALKSDYIRARLLSQYGGLWQDIDCVAVSDYSKKVLPLLNSYEFLGMRKTSKSQPYISNNFIASRPGGVVVSKYLELMEQLIIEKNQAGEKYAWTELGSEMLTPIVDQHIDKVYLFDEEQIHPFDFTEYDLFEEPEIGSLLSQRVNKKTICIMLYNSLFSEKIKKMTGESLLSSNILLSKILKSELNL